MRTDLKRDDLERLGTLSEAAFVQEWRRLTGEPPACMLERPDMLTVLAGGDVMVRPRERRARSRADESRR